MEGFDLRWRKRQESSHRDGFERCHDLETLRCASWALKIGLAFWGWVVYGVATKKMASYEYVVVSQMTLPPTIKSFSGKWLFPRWSFPFEVQEIFQGSPRTMPQLPGKKMSNFSEKQLGIPEPSIVEVSYRLVKLIDSTFPSSSEFSKKRSANFLHCCY